MISPEGHNVINCDVDGVGQANPLGQVAVQPENEEPGKL